MMKKSKLIFKHNSFDLVEKVIMFYVLYQVKNIIERLKLLEC